MAEAHEPEGIVLVLGLVDELGHVLDTSPIWFSMSSTASLAPPCAGPQSEAIPAATQAKGLAPELPASRTVEVLAFCS
jgi:hypothetical protein